MNNWQELVPFYVAGLLSASEKAAFEAFMMRSTECQQAVAEWQTIAKAVYDEADSRSKRLPSLSSMVRSQLNVQPYVTRNGHHSTDHLEETVMAYHAPRVEYANRPRDAVQRQPVRRLSPTPIFAVSALAAAAVLFFVCAVALFFVMQNNQDAREEGSRPKNTPTAIATHPPDTSSTPGATRTTVPILVSPEPADNATRPVVTDAPSATYPVPAVLNYIPSPTAFQTEAPPDQDEYFLTVDKFAAVSFSEIISYPNGDTTDSIHLELAGLTDEDNYRELQIIVYCMGENTEALRWYWGFSNSLQNAFFCGQTGSLVLSQSSSEEQLTLTFQDNGESSAVAYTINIVPTLLDGTPVATPTPLPPETAPQDIDPHVFDVQPYSAQQFSEKLSLPMPEGDGADNLNLNLIYADVGIRYQFSLLMTCKGYDTDALRWSIGNGEFDYHCGEEVPGIFLSTADNRKLVTVILDEKGYANYVEYTLIARPIQATATPASDGSTSAPSDAEPHDFIVTRSSNRFTEQVSYPTGDQLDRIHMTIADMQPGEARELEISMTCSGTGIEYLTWTTLVGQKTNTCGGTLYATLTDTNNKISFDVTFTGGFVDTSMITYAIEVKEAP